MSASDSQTTAGWVIFIAALGMLCGMLAIDIASLMTWSDMTKPVFVGTMLGHCAAVVAAFVGGKLIPPDRDARAQTRRTDPPAQRTDLPPAA